MATVGGAAETSSIIHIRPTTGWNALNLHELWEYRELLVFLAWREIQGTYRQTALGMSWLFIRPIVSILVMTITFGVVINVPSDGAPYPLFAAAGLLPWGYFSASVLRSSGSLVSNMHIISKVYVPRLVFPISTILSGLVDLAASSAVFICLLMLYRLPLRPQVIVLPGFVLVAMLVALTFGLWSASLSVRYRDVAFAMAFLLQAMMYASPVIYPLNMVPPQLLPLYVLNPMTGVIQGFRWALLGSNEAPGKYFVLSIGLTIGFLIVGAFLVRRTERTMVDNL